MCELVNVRDAKELCMRDLAKLDYIINASAMSEIFNFSAEAKLQGRTVGTVFDLTHGWGRENRVHQKRAEEIIEAEDFILGACHCRMCSQLMIRNKDKMREYAAQFEEAISYYEWSCKVYKDRVERGRFFLIPRTPSYGLEHTPRHCEGDFGYTGGVIGPWRPVSVWAVGCEWRW